MKFSDSKDKASTPYMIRLKNDLLERLTKIAKKKGRGKAEIIREWISEGVLKEEIINRKSIKEAESCVSLLEE